MKKLMMWPVMALICASAFVLFGSCSGEENEENGAMASKADLLRLKAKEFAKKYNVRMSLNEENIEYLAETLSVEEMENDFRMFAEEQKHPKVYTFDDTEKTKKVEKRLTIKRTKSLEEEREKVEEGSFKKLDIELIRINNNKPSRSCSYKCDITVSWRYLLKGVSYAKMEISNLRPGSASCSGEITPSFSTNGGFNFTASGKIHLKTMRYNYEFVCSVYYHKNGNKSIHVDSDFPA